MKKTKVPKPIKIGSHVRYIGAVFRKVIDIDEKREYIRLEGIPRWHSPCGLSSYTNKIRKEKGNGR